jgi:hypothetical protein
LLADGAPCGVDSQCTSAYCGTGKSAICGTCGKAPAAGDACDVKKCGPALTCSDATKKCVVPLKSGSACTATDTCELGNGCQDGTCQPAASTAGAACSTDGKGAPLCDLLKGLFCEPVSKKCKAFVVAKATETCGYDTAGANFVICERDGLCIKAKTTDLQGKCLAAAAAGAACNLDETVGPKCQEGLACVGGTCKASNPASCK